MVPDWYDLYWISAIFVPTLWLEPSKSYPQDVLCGSSCDAAVAGGIGVESFCTLHVGMIKWVPPIEVNYESQVVVQWHTCTCVHTRRVPHVYDKVLRVCVTSTATLTCCLCPGAERPFLP